MSFAKLRAIEAAESTLCQQAESFELEPSWVYTGHRSFLCETIERCPAAWRAAVTECIVSLNSALSSNRSAKAALRDSAIAQLEFDFSGPCAKIRVTRQPVFDFYGEIKCYRHPLSDKVIRGIARRLQERTANICQTCGGKKHPKSTLSRCSSCDSVIRSGQRLGKELRTFLNTIRHDATHGRRHGHHGLGSVPRQWPSHRTLEQLQDFLISSYWSSRSK
ncbi:hypothetical protein [Aquabacterium sp. A08]|uniref:hypothetical protein n=1 Tax=Aquabacterium sp. A08 TaxID=2718532 RepID=UPI00141EFB22|nr:hypothetical protein [Aquabacterium sp. A08]NIC42639.1 hypothetical protein [Aquabacterium sp. A08]